MIIGFMRKSPKPTEMAKLTAMIGKHKGIDIIYLQPHDVNMEDNTVNGKMFINNKWISTKTSVPEFIDISPFCYNQKNREVMRYLRKHTFLSDNGLSRLNKEKLQEKLLEDSQFAHLVIPTQRVQGDFSNVEDFLDKYQTVVLKPVASQRGKGIYILEKRGDAYKLGYNKMEKNLSLENVKGFFETSIKGKGYIMQKYVSSRTLNGDPFDCRVHAEKNGKGKWVKARIYIRIGIGQKVISNVNQGGGISDPKPFLKANFGSRWEEINGALDKLAVTLPYKIEELRHTHIMSLGIDAALDSDGKLYLFEVNSAPATAALTAEVAMLRTSYYKYVIESNMLSMGFEVEGRT